MAETTPTTREQVAKEQLAKDKEARQRIVDETTEKTENVKPTPTQEENDRARMGEDVAHKEDDGSGPEMNPLTKAKDEAKSEKPAPAAPRPAPRPPNT